ncbi:hypothetical protein DOK67_0001768 [Enterococcus sp. DIV0212c]|uniref:hypothetical protein n=1 Tax=Enterococcus sp. DIV0212c TaxID=2230867 RepID=UPI001A9C0B70|nr:hypothetical protein [Enterococcus sp. DIV0212c]MBO1353832.1 hypothetical protein [Enterococcus sp. DIV0212c]
MKADGKKLKSDEAGYALLYALGAIVIVSLVMMGIFLRARNNFLQISAVDQLAKMKDVKEYALQEASMTIKKTIETKLSGNIQLGLDNTVLTTKMSEVTKELQNQPIQKSNLGKQQDFSYTVTVSEPTVSMINPYKFISEDNGASGWMPMEASDLKNGIVNTNTTFQVEVNVEQTVKNGQKKQSSSKGDYVYEFQWAQGQQGAEALKLDAWRYVYYQPTLADGDELITADTWIRKMDRIYRYQSNQPLFPYAEYFSNYETSYGRSNNFLVDLQDGTFLNFWKGTNSVIYKDLNVAGSFLLKNGVLMSGKKSITSKNIIALRNDENLTQEINAIKNLNIKADVGMYVTIDVNNSTNKNAGLYVDNDSYEIKTPNLLINNTGSGKTDKGFFLAKGEITLEKETTSNSSINFGEYASDTKINNPVDKYWNQFMDGGFVIAGSNVFLTPPKNTIKVDGVAVTAGKNDKRRIQVKSGNFMLTSASLLNQGEETFAYADKGTYTSKARPPALLELEGQQTSLTVENGVSFIDAPKMKRRGSNAKKVTYYNDKKYWNTIRLKDSSRLDLGIAGIEPFNLETQANTTISMKLLPNLELFDTTFIKEGLKKGKETIKGKLIIEVATKEDGDLLIQELEKEVPIEEGDQSKAKNGVVTIVKPAHGVVPKNNSQWIIQRVFDYTNNVSY